MNRMLFVLALAYGVVFAETDAQISSIRSSTANRSPASDNLHYLRPCTAKELLPQSIDDTKAPAMEWAISDTIDPLYGCKCPSYKAGYFCPRLTVGGSFKWVPRSVSDGICQEAPFSQIRDTPLPPEFRVLIYGNSHLRQVVESIACMFQQAIKRKRVTINHENKMVPASTQCRSCIFPGVEQMLMEHDCVTTDVECMCSDDKGEYFFENGAVIHYTFAHTQEEKRIESGLQAHGIASMSHYNAVVANSGNPPYLTPSSLLRSADELQQKGVQLIWLSEYDSAGDISEWETSLKSRLSGTGAMFLPIHYMVRGLEQWTRGYVEGRNADGDPHYCLPGPPDQIGLLLLRIFWALYDK